MLLDACYAAGSYEFKFVRQSVYFLRKSSDNFVWETAFCLESTYDPLTFSSNRMSVKILGLTLSPKMRVECNLQYSSFV